MKRLLLLVALSSSVPAADIRWLTDEVVNQARKAVVSVEVAGNGPVTGFYISDDGLIVTSADVLEGVTNVTVVTSDQQKIQGSKLLFVDATRALAVLATGRTAPAHLKIRQDVAQVKEACAVIYSSAGVSKVADSVLLARGSMLDTTETRFQDLWALNLAPDKVGVTGAPIITADGSVVGICSSVGGAGIHRRQFAFPEVAIRDALAQAREAARPVPFPQLGEFLGFQYPEGDDFREGMQFTSLGDYQKARSKFEATLIRYPENPLVIGRLADMCLMAGDLQNGERWLRECIRITPGKMLPHVQLGFLLRDRGDTDAALRHFQDITLRFPKLAQAWAGAAMVLHGAGQLEKAADAAKKWTELQPDSSAAWEKYAEMLTATKDYAGASQARDQASEIESIMFKIRYAAPERK